MYEEAKKHFKDRDQLLYQAALDIELEEIAPSEDLFRDIVWTIIGQQLSARAADTIFSRFQELFRGGHVTSKAILRLKEKEMRTCGLSGAKMRAIQSLARAIDEKHLNVVSLATMNNEEIVAALTRIKGIGPWTAQMLLMFSFARPDVFSTGDLGLKKGIIELYGVKTFQNQAKLERLLAAWSPYRSYAARILWKLSDRKTARVGRKRPDKKH